MCMWLDLVPRLSFGTTTYSVGTQAEPGFETKVEMMPIRDGHADIFGDAHRCRYPHYLTYVGYSAILSDNAEVDEDIRIRMAIPNQALTRVKKVNSRVEREI